MEQPEPHHERLDGVFVRAAQRRDARAIARLHRDTARVAYRGIFPRDAPEPDLGELTRDWGRRIGDANQVSAIAQAGTEVVGAVSAMVCGDDADCGQLARLYVARDWWGRGVGTMLHQHALAWMRTKCCTRATLWVLEGNQRGRQWYERRGWQPNGQRISTYAPSGVDDLGYDVTLDP